MAKMKARALVDKAVDIAKNHKTLYVMGCFGAPLTGGNVTRYCSNHTYNKAADRTAMIKAAANQSPPVYGFDCVCLIKGILWGWSGNPSATYGGAKYASNGVQDIGADQTIKVCTGVTTDFSSITLGEAVWCSGHIGIYIGDGLAVECTPKWENKVQITAVANMGAKPGYNARTWTKHGKLPWVDYSDEVGTAPAKPSTGASTAATTLPDIGTEVDFKGTKHFVSSNSTNPKSCKPGKAKVTALAKNGKHPVHLIRTSGGGSTVYGWVDLSDISTGSAAELRTHKVVKGDTLWGIAQKYLGNGNRYKEIMELNGLKSSTIYAGQVFKIPAK